MQRMLRDLPAQNKIESGLFFSFTVDVLFEFGHQSKIKDDAIWGQSCKKKYQIYIKETFSPFYWIGADSTETGVRLSD